MLGCFVLFECFNGREELSVVVEWRGIVGIEVLRE